MFNFNIVPLEVENLDLICDDIEKLVNSGIITMPLFNMTLVPEGTPPVDKAGELSERFKLFRAELSKRGIKAGVLLQSTIGHGYLLNEPNPFQHYYGMLDEVTRDVCCPLDRNVVEHFYNVCRTIAKAGADFMLIDDDFRMLGRSGRGCACPLHMAELEKRTGMHLTVPELRERLKSDMELSRIFDELQCDSLVNMAKRMRQGVDEINPRIAGGYCPCRPDIRHAYPIAKAFAGEGNPILIRLNGAYYNARGPRNFTRGIQAHAFQMAEVRDKADIVLSESDTCFHNRYSTAAAVMHSHYSAALLEGCDGAKHWISRLRGNEWKSAKAYRDILTRNNGFYKKLIEIGKNISWTGLRVPIPEKTFYSFDAEKTSLAENWTNSALERLGLPLCFSQKNCGSAIMSGMTPIAFSDDEIRKLLSGDLFLDCEAAAELCSRGFGEFLGVDVQPWDLPRATCEIMPEGRVGCQEKLRHLILKGAEEDSRIYHGFYVQSNDLEYIAPGTTVFRNSLGGRVIIFAGTPPSEGLAAAAFLCENRKNQFIRLLQESGNLPCYYMGDADMYAKAGFMPDGSLLGIYFNLGCDQLNSLDIGTADKVNSVQYLTPDGEWADAAFNEIPGGVDVQIRAETMMPVILRFS